MLPRLPPPQTRHPNHLLPPVLAACHYRIQSYLSPGMTVPVLPSDLPVPQLCFQLNLCKTIHCERRNTRAGPVPMVRTWSQRRMPLPVAHTRQINCACAAFLVGGAHCACTYQSKHKMNEWLGGHCARHSAQRARSAAAALQRDLRASDRPPRPPCLRQL